MKRIVASIIALCTLSIAVAQPALAAVDVFEICNTTPPSNSAVCKATSDAPLFGPDSIWTKILNAFIFIIGAVAVLMIIISGMKYVMSNGDQSQISSAKNTILYAIVGLIVALMSYAIVNFVLNTI